MHFLTLACCILLLQKEQKAVIGSNIQHFYSIFAILLSEIRQKSASKKKYERGFDLLLALSVRNCTKKKNFIFTPQLRVGSRKN